jgi:ketosteroid isomerase-like protein
MTPRAFLAELQHAVAAKDRAATLDLLTGDVVLFGTAAANLDRATTDAYLQQIFELDGVVRWDWETIHVVDERAGAITFVALGSVDVVEPGQLPAEQPQPIRLTALIVDDGDRWRLRHFHGSTPEAP